MKRIFKQKTLILLLFLAIFMFSLGACADEPPQPQPLTMSELSYDKYTAQVSWQKVQNASSYSVFVNQIEYQTLQNSFTLFELANADYEISVIARSTHPDYLDSLPKTIIATYTLSESALKTVANRSIDYIRNASNPFISRDVLNNSDFASKGNKYRLTQNSVTTIYHIESSSASETVVNRYVSSEEGYNYYCDYYTTPFTHRIQSEKLIEFAKQNLSNTILVGERYFSKGECLQQILSSYYNFFDIEPILGLNLSFFSVMARDGYIVSIEINFSNNDILPNIVTNFYYVPDFDIEIPQNYNPVLGLNPLLAYTAPINTQIISEIGTFYYIFQAQQATYTITLQQSNQTSIKIMTQTKIGSINFSEISTINDENPSTSLQTQQGQVICLQVTSLAPTNFLISDN